MIATLVDLNGRNDRTVRICTADNRASVTAAAATGAWTGHWLLPGLVDAHVHVSGMPADAAVDFVSSGVLTVRDLGGKADRVLSWPGQHGPRIVSFGGQVDQYPLPEHLSATLGAVAVRHFGNVTTHLDHLVRAGAAGMKLYAGFPPELVAAAVDAAHQAGLQVAFHLGSGSLPAFRRTTVHDALGAGVDSIEHVHSLTGDLLPAARLGVYVRDVLDSVAAAFGRVFAAWSEINPASAHARRVIDLFAERGTVLVPTVAPFAAMARGLQAPTGGVVGVFNRTAAVDRGVLDAGLAHMLDFVSALDGAGALVALGTDVADRSGMVPGTSLHQEMLLLLEAGVGAREVLRMACAWGERAGRLGIPRTFADDNFVVVRGPSLLDALKRWDVRLVVAGGSVRHTAGSAETISAPGGLPGTPLVPG